MIASAGSFWQVFASTAWSIGLESAPWVIISLLVGGLVHEFAATDQLRKRLNRQGLAGMGAAVLLGAVLPICSCGVIPLAVSLYRSGVRRGTVMAFAAATPIINPAAVILAFALLGSKITLAYMLLGVGLPMLLGIATERWGDPGAPVSPPRADKVALHVEADQPSLSRRLLRGARWGVFDLGPSIGFYLLIGIILAALLMTVVPTDWVTRFLGGNAVLGLAAVALFGACIYVCAVANIPLAATLLAAGAGPGAAIVFLVTGTATNLPELIALYNTIGRRTVLIYVSTLVVAAFATGLLVNAWLLPGFSPDLDPLRSLDLVASGARWQPTFSAALADLSVYAMLALGGVGTWQWLCRRFTARTNAVASCGSNSCCGE